ncbi:hypothetical protein ACIGHM_29050 [Streptomyces diastaticus]|uniref:hypothetical protein n=1 Tax=Streptomyces diastaticus TaxID=1956 RepID=UPI0037D2B513
MKNLISILLVTFLFISCSKDEETPEEIINEGYISLQLSESFLFDEKWYLHEASDIVTEDNLLTETLACELDSYYVFNTSEIRDSFALNQGETECEDLRERYGSGLYEFTIDTGSNSLFLKINESIMLGGFTGAFQLREVEFLLSDDSSTKIIKGVINVEVDGVKKDINYSLISYSNDRP